MRFLLPSLLLAMTAHAQPIDVPRMVEALIAVEGGDWQHLGGAANLSIGAWNDRRPDIAFTLSMNEPYCRGVYADHVRWIVAQIERTRSKVTPEAVGMCWRWGFEGARAMRLRGDYGVRASNLYESLAQPAKTNHHE